MPLLYSAYAHPCNIQTHGEPQTRPCTLRCGLPIGACHVN